MIRYIPVFFLLCVFLLTDRSDVYGQFLIRAGSDVFGQHESVLTFSDDKSIKKATEIGYLLSAEFIHPLFYNNLVLAGIGIEMQLPRAVKNIEGKFRFTSLYAAIRLRPYPVNSPHLFLRGGFNLFYGDKHYDSPSWEGDEYSGMGIDLDFKLYNFLHYGIGIGIFLNEKFLIEAFYSMNLGVRNYKERIPIYDYIGKIIGWKLRDLDVDVYSSRISLCLGFRF